MSNLSEQTEEINICYIKKQLFFNLLTAVLTIKCKFMVVQITSKIKNNLSHLEEIECFD